MNADPVAAANGLPVYSSGMHAPPYTQAPVNVAAYREPPHNLV
jgi:hypothetical protein